MVPAADAKMIRGKPCSPVDEVDVVLPAVFVLFVAFTLLAGFLLFVVFGLMEISFPELKAGKPGSRVYTRCVYKHNDHTGVAFL
jgi:hypothetical protein